MSEPKARVLLDSITRDGDRVTTVEVTHHRFILAETNTHGAISKNSASSRAIPLVKMLDKFINDPAYPSTYRAEQSGMTAGGELEEKDLAYAMMLFGDYNQVTAEIISRYIQRMIDTYGEDEYKKHILHKSWVNRLMEPMQWHTALWTFDNNLYQNFLNQRAHPDAQPEFHILSESLKEELAKSKPQILGYDDWHMPLLREEDEDDIWELAKSRSENSSKNGLKLPTMLYVQKIKREVSVARCARVSYLTHEGTRDIEKDIQLHNRLCDQNPPHASPFEHICTPAPWNKYTVKVPQLSGFSKEYKRPKIGKFYGWLQLRHAVGMS